MQYRFKLILMLKLIFFGNEQKLEKSGYVRRARNTTVGELFHVIVFHRKLRKPGLMH